MQLSKNHKYLNKFNKLLTLSSKLNKWKKNKSEIELKRASLEMNKKRKPEGMLKLKLRRKPKRPRKPQL